MTRFRSLMTALALAGLGSLAALPAAADNDRHWKNGRGPGGQHFQHERHGNRDGWHRSDRHAKWSRRHHYRERHPVRYRWHGHRHHDHGRELVWLAGGVILGEALHHVHHAHCRH
jgi:hypothetical protein